MPVAEPPRDCPRCPRLIAFREANRIAFPAYHNAPVPAFASPEARLLVVGLAPGLRGPHQTGRPFTGDYAGDLLSLTFLRFGLAEGRYARHSGRESPLTPSRATTRVICSTRRS